MKHNLLKSLIISVILLTGVSNAWAGITAVAVEKPSNSLDYNKVKLNIDHKGNDGDEWKQLDMTLLPITFEGKNLYIKEYSLKYEDKATSTYDYLGALQFQLYDDAKWVDENMPILGGGWTHRPDDKSIWNYEYDDKEAGWYSGLGFVGNSNFYFDATDWSDMSNVKLCIAHLTWHVYYELTNIPNTKLYYVKHPGGWGDAMGISVVGSTTDGSGQGIISEIPNSAQKYTGFKHWGFEYAGNTAYFMVNKGDRGEMPDMYYYDNFSSLNHIQTIKTVVDGTTANSKANIAIKSHQITRNGVAEEQNKSLTTSSNIATISAARTATTTLTVDLGSLDPNYKFEGWYDENGKQLTTEFAYTYYPTTENTIYARFKEAPSRTVYLKPSHSWKSDNAQFAVKYGGTNHMMIEVEECCEGKYYKVTIPSQCSKLNFVRLSDNGTTEWNVTGEISVPTDGKNLYDMTKIYLKPNANWKSDDARFAAYFFYSNDMLNKNKWMSMLPTDEDGVFYCDFPTDHIFDYVSLTRMNGAISDNEWNYRWNQTSDFNLYEGYNLYELQGDKWGKDNGGNNHDGMTEKRDYKWTTYNSTYSVTLEPTPYGHYTVEYNGRTYKSATDKNVVIEDVALGATIRVSKGTPDNSAEYTDDMLLQKASGYGNTIELKGQEYYDHTICGTTTIAENFVTKNPHTVYLRVPTTIEAAWNDDDQGLSLGANCVYYTHILGGGIHIMDNVTNSINGEDGYSYYQLTIPAGYRTFCFQRKSGSDPTKWKERNYTANFTHALPFINGLNCFTILGSDDDDYYYGEWGTLLQEGDYRLLYVEQVVEKDADGYTVITRKKAHPSNIIKKGTDRQIVSLHTYKDRKYAAKLGDGLDDYESSNNPEIILQKYSEDDQWEDVECQMVYGPLETLPIMANLPGRKNASSNSTIDDLKLHNGIENIKNDDHPDQGNGVWNFVVTQDGEGNASVQWDQTHRYTGEYYIRTDVAVGGWNNYTAFDNYMTFSSYSKTYRSFSHYFCKWILSGNNVGFTIANNYGLAISDTLYGDDLVTTGILPEPANVRFSWNMVNNEIARAYIRGTWTTDKLPTRIDNLVAEYSPKINSKDTVHLDDTGDWIYSKDINNVPVNSELVSLTAKYPTANSEIQTFAKDMTMLTGNNSNDNTYVVRVLYDFKIDKTLVALVPNDKQADIGIDVLMERIDQDPMTTQVKAGITSQKDEGGSTVYGVMTFTKSHLIAPEKSEQQKLTYWISFPFDVRLSDIFGFGAVGKYWMIKFYDGASRAKNGLYDDNTYWKFITNSKYVLKANQGYVLSLDKKVMDSNSTIYTNTDKISLYFPSKDKITNINENFTTPCDIPMHECTITSPTDRRIYDSNWNLIGVPSYGNHETTTNDNVKYFYDYNHASDSYTVAKNTGTKIFQAMFAYMVQFAGTIDWSTFFTENGAQGLAAKKSNAAYNQHNLRLELQQSGSKLDHTFVQLQDEDATEMFDMNSDLCKIINAGSNIYSIITTESTPIQVAGNVMPIQETIIPLGIKTDAAGEYTFAMPDGTDGIVVELIDYETNTRTNMLLDNYTITLGKGTFENRFALHVQPSKVTTSVEDVTTNSNGVKKYLIDGVLYMQKDGVLYDAQGKLVR